ncbi:hypothetical protein BaRGS_00031588 [Batillaria attramentaria]|uniref:Uncharacterized protein n=1 Tax=Batillaria attramentaria TaxID=370345 RepID=A0ABD0JQ60_9CAEN
MHSLAAFVLAALMVGQVRPQQEVCAVDNANVYFVLDLSETARRESTTGGNFQRDMTDYDLLRDSLRSFAENSRLTRYRASTANLRVGFISYTGFENVTRVQATVTGGLDSLNSMITNVIDDTNGNIPDRILTKDGTETGGSWTYNGLEKLVEEIQSGALNSFPSGADNWVFLISAQGSFRSTRQDRARAAANVLKAAGFRIFVTGLVMDNDEFNIDVEELGDVSTSSNTTILISSYGPTRPSTDQVRPTLREALRDFVSNWLLKCRTVATTTPIPTDNPCTGCDFSTGKYLVPDPAGCAGFLLCHPDLTYTRMDCGDGTLYDADLMTCSQQNKYNCPAWGTCTGTTQRKLPARCCRQYYDCDRGVVTFRRCPGDQIFDQSSEQCVPNTPSSFATNCGSEDEYNIACRINIGSQGRLLNCSRGQGIADLYRNVENEPCMFEQFNGEQWVQHRCAEGTGWDTSKCICDHNSACLTQQRTPFSSTCRSRFHVGFNDNPAAQVRAIDDETNERLNVWIAKKETRFTGTTARFAGNRGREADVVSIPYFNNRDWRNFAVTIRFRLASNAAVGTFYDILSNDNCGQVRVIFDVRNSNDDIVSMQADVTKDSQDQWLEVTLAVQDNQVRGNVKVLRADGSGAPLNTVPLRQQGTNAEIATLAGGVGRVHCALGIGQGRENAMVGEVDDFKYYECDNPFSVV